MHPCPKPVTVRDKDYLEWLRDQPPLIQGTGQTVCHHLKILKSGSMGKKPSDTDCIPISDSVHQLIHSSGRRGGEKNVLLTQHKFTTEMLRDLCDAYYRVYQREKAQNG